MQYVRYKADGVMRQMKYALIYGAKNPFRTMDKLELNDVNKTNFFEAIPSEYQNITVNGASDFRIDDTPLDDE
jgi:ribonucleotide reductase beta subunit family protein with ferritin-like domain